MYKIIKTSMAFKVFAVAIAVILMFLSVRAFAADYKVDKEHSRIGFIIKHLMLTNIHGQFSDFTGTFSFDPLKNTMTNANFTVKTASIYTGVEKRDEHLRSADFFEVEKYPTMTLSNVSIKRIKRQPLTYTLTGDLSLHGKVRRESFTLVYTGTKKDKTGATRAGFSMTGKINRLNYDMSWAPQIEGGVMINHEVVIEIDISAIEESAPAPSAPNDKLYNVK